LAKVFLSWSGRESENHAAAWRNWIRDVFPDAEVFLSSSDIDAGDDWRKVISKQIRNSKIGIVFVTAENMRSPWILFEAGALAIAKRRRLVVCMVSGSPGELPSPLSAFHTVNTDKKGAEKIFAVLQAEIGQPRAKFFLVWPSLEGKLRTM